MEYFTAILQSFLLSVSSLLGADTATPEHAPAVISQQKPAEVRVGDEPQSTEDEELDAALAQLRGVQERLKEPEVVEGMPVQRIKRVQPKVKTQTRAQTIPTQLPQQQVQRNDTPSFVKPVAATQGSTVQPTTGSPLAASFDAAQPVGSILFNPLPHQNIELVFREVPASIGSHYELQWDIPTTLTCSIVVFQYKSDSQVSSTWMKSVAGKGKKNTDPLYQDQRYRLLCKNSKGIYHADTILFRTRSTAHSLPTCTIVPSRTYVTDGESVTFTIGGSDIETFAFGNTRPVVPDSAMRFPFTHTRVMRTGAEPFTVTVGNRLGTSTCNAFVTVGKAEAGAQNE